MRRQSSGSGAFWLQLTLQTAALISAASASEYVDRAPTKLIAEPQYVEHFVIPDLADDAFLYSSAWEPSTSFDDCDRACQAAMRDFDRPVLMPTPEFDLLGGLDSLQEPDSQDWLFVY